MAAYAARAGLKAVVLVPRGQIAKGKLIQAVVHGAKIVQVQGNFDRALERVRKLVENQRGFYLVNSVNPYRIEGQKTLAFEVWEQLGRRVPDVVCLPVGNAGNISAIWKGFSELRELNLVESEPRMLGVQAEGAAPLAEAFKMQATPIAWKSPKTVASAIRIGAPASWKKALRAVKESRGAILSVSDNEIIRAQMMLATLEGIFVEPASAASIAGIFKAVRLGFAKPQERIVCVVTGHGLKDQTVVADRIDL
jgi:threonine synthase